MRWPLPHSGQAVTAIDSHRQLDLRPIGQHAAHQFDVGFVVFDVQHATGRIQLVVGFANPILMDIPPGLDVTVEKQTHLTVTGVDRQLVGQVAANMRRLRKPDPYQQKGVRYTGEVLKKKVGKTGAK